MLRSGRAGFTSNQLKCLERTVYVISDDEERIMLKSHAFGDSGLVYATVGYLPYPELKDKSEIIPVPDGS